MPSYYDILGVTGDTDEKGIRQAYRKLARQWHPDVNPGDSEAEAKFKQINEAYEVLSDPEKRVKYDKYGNDWKHADERDKARASQGRGDFTYWFSGSPDFDGQMGGVSGGAFDDILSGFRRGRSRPQRLRYDVDVTLEEAFRGTTRIVDVPILSGEGSKRIEVKIPPGVDDGSTVRVPVGDGKETEVRFNIRLREHSKFRRSGADLYTEVDVPALDAVLGGEAAVPTLTKRVALTIPPETQNGQTFRLAGQGMPRLNRPDSRGDLHVTVKAALPKGLTDEERRLFEEIKESLNSRRQPV